MAYPRLRPVADHALLVEFGDTISASLHERVMRLDRAIEARPITGMIETVPAYVSLLVDFDPLATDHEEVAAAVRERLAVAPAEAGGRAEREVLVCYEDALARDLPEVASRTGLSREAVINAHLSGDYRVFMYGFAPGFAYMAGVPEPIRLARKDSPVRGIPTGSVMIAGPQCLVTTITMPTGWWIIGRSPTQILDPEGTRPFLFDVGDRVRFRRIGVDELGMRSA